MKIRIRKRLSLSVIATLMFTSAVWAQPLTPRGSGIALMGGYAIFNDNSFKETALLGLSLNLAIARNFSITAEGQLISCSNDGSPTELSQLSKGRLGITPICLGLQVRLPLRTLFTPFLEAGGEYFINNYQTDSQLISDWSRVGLVIDETVSSTFGFYAGIGLDMFVIQKLAFSISARYTQANTSGTWKLTDNSSDLFVTGDINDINLGGVSLALGLKYIFN